MGRLGRYRLALLVLVLLLSWSRVQGEVTAGGGPTSDDDAQLDTVLANVLGKGAALRATAAASLGSSVTGKVESVGEVIRQTAIQNGDSAETEVSAEGKKGSNAAPNAGAKAQDKTDSGEGQGVTSAGSGGAEKPEEQGHKDVRQGAEGLGLHVLSGGKVHDHAPPPALAGTDKTWSKGSLSKVHSAVSTDVDPNTASISRAEYAKKLADDEHQNAHLYGENEDLAKFDTSNVERKYFDFSQLSYDDTLKGEKIPSYTYEENIKSLPPEPLAETTDAMRLLMSRADPQYHPSTGYIYRGNITDPTYVHVRLFIENIHTVSVKDGEFTGEFTIKAAWHDPRLAYREKDFNGASFLVMSGLDKDFDLKRLTWTPHLYIYNAISKKNMKQNIRVHRTGSVEFIRSFTGSMTNQWKLRLFPFDTQHIHLLLEEWRDSSDTVVIVGDELTLNPRMDGEILEYKVTSMDEPSSGIFMYDSGLGFSYVTYHFSMTRRVGGYFSKNFLPLAFITLAGCISFMIDPKAVPARISVVCLTFLTALAYSGSISKELPNVAELTVMDQYMMISIALAFFNVFEFAYVHVMGRIENNDGKQVEIFWQVGKMADRVSVFVYPSVFLLVNIVYLVVVPLVFGEYYEW